MKNEKLVTVPCFVGKKCWCRMVAYESYLLDRRKTKKILIPGACIHKKDAERLVKTYNDAIENGARK